MTDRERLQEAIMRMTMCARRECAVCKYSMNEQPSEDCDGRITANMNVLADLVLREADPAVVKCGECRHSHKATVNGKGFLICPATGLDITENDFCFLGERRGEE